MPPRHPDETPSRPVGTKPSTKDNRGTTKDTRATTKEADEPVRRSRITEARGYHPRGRTVAEATGRRGGDPFRPALRLVADAGEDDGRPLRRRTTTHRATRAAAPSRSGNEPDDRGPATTTRTERARTATRGQAERPRTKRLSVAVAPKLADQGARLRLATAIVMALFLVIAGRLVEFQFSDAAAYAAQGLQARLQPVDLPAPRGSILDRNGAVLAGSAEARYVFADPSRVEDPGKTADALSPLLGVPRSELLPKLVSHKRDDGSEALFEYLARGVPVAMGDSVSALGLKGVGVRRDETRVVPGHDLAANLIGFTGRDLQGLGGLEESFNDLLHGVDGNRRFEIGQQEVNLDHEIPGGYHEETPARPGSSLQLTIDRDLQFEIQRILAARMAQAKAYTGSAVVLDVRTGEVLAQASYPFYDAANPFASQPGERGDMAAGMTVDPGSVHKAIVFAACLQEGVVTPATWSTCRRRSPRAPRPTPTPTTTRET
jgi:cell division protein FtsI (penicillin-binding protein 3)